MFMLCMYYLSKPDWSLGALARGKIKSQNHKTEEEKRWSREEEQYNKTSPWVVQINYVHKEDLKTISTTRIPYYKKYRNLN